MSCSKTMTKVKGLSTEPLSCIDLVMHVNVVKYGVPFVSKLKMCWYLQFMLVFTIHAGIYDSCRYLRFMLVFTIHAGIYDSCWYLRFMLVFTIHAGIYDSCWYLHFMLVS